MKESANVKRNSFRVRSSSRPRPITRVAKAGGRPILRTSSRMASMRSPRA